ncbi:hypothetical protein ABE288_05760 [Bacillus salipaludis]|uniref:hypothetical protein n=1 Tax=Bacillus salipaludis TaxID=2547811 RepID=UPI003D216E2D
MHQHWYMNLKGSGQLFNNQISVPPFYSHPQISIIGGLNGLVIPAGRSGQVYPAGWNSLEGLKSFVRMEQLVNWAPPSGQMGLTEQESSSGWTTPADNHDYTSQKQPGNGLPPVNHDDWESHEQPANWQQLPVLPGGHNGNGLPSVDYDDWESQEQPVNWPQLPVLPGFPPQGQTNHWVQPIHPAGMFTQGPSLGGAPSAGNTGFNPQKKPYPWAQLFNHAGMFGQGHLPALQTPSAIPYGFGASGQQANWGAYGNPTSLGGQVNPMGWGAVGPDGMGCCGPRWDGVLWAPMGWDKGRPGILGGLLKVGKGTMNGIGMISSLISVGKFLF